MKLSQGDTVAIIAGKDKGKQGTILRVLKAENRVIVSGINMVTKHVKKTPQSAGKIIRFEHSLDASNVAALDPKTKKPTRIGYGIDEKTGHKIRIAKKSGVLLERVKLSKDALKTAEVRKQGDSVWKKDATPVTSEPDSHTTAPVPHATATKITHSRSGGRGS
jgi:large subunit ribosomal protein L24